MRRTAAERFCAPLTRFVEAPLRYQPPFQYVQSQPFSQTLRHRAEPKDTDQRLPYFNSITKSTSRDSGLDPSKSSLRGVLTDPTAKGKGTLEALSTILTQNQTVRFEQEPSSSLDTDIAEIQRTRFQEPHHLHVYTHKHNTHITLTRPNRDPIISMSTGNLGFRKAARKTYDAAHQLAGYVMGRIQEQGLNMEIRHLELVLRGYGPGREAVTKALLGTEGKFLRSKVVKVSDSTRLKFGGARSKKPRRLG